MVLADSKTNSAFLHTTTSILSLEPNDNAPALPSESNNLEVDGFHFNTLCELSGDIETTIARAEKEAQHLRTTSDEQKQNEIGSLILKNETNSALISTNDFNLVAINLVIGFRFILGLYIWFSELITPIPDPYRYFNWYHTVSGLPTSSIVVIWKITELCMVITQRNLPYSTLLSSVALFGSIVLLTSGILAIFEERPFIKTAATASAAVICFKVGILITCLANVLEALIGIFFIFFRRKFSKSQHRSLRTVIAALLQAVGFTCLLLDLVRKQEFLRGLSAFSFILEGIVLSGSKISTERSFLFWYGLFKIFGCIGFLVAAGTFDRILQLNETYSDFPSFFPMERGLALPFYILLVCIWFDVDFQLSNLVQSIPKPAARLALVFFIFGVLPTFLIASWIGSTATSSSIATATTIVSETNLSRKFSLLIASSGLLTLTSLIRGIIVTRLFLSSSNKSPNVSTKEEDDDIPLNQRRYDNDRFHSETMSDEKQMLTDKIASTSKTDMPEKLLTNKEGNNDNASSLSSSYTCSESSSVFGPVGDLFRFIASVMVLLLSFVLYLNQNYKQVRNNDLRNQLMLLSIGIGTVYLLHAFCWIQVMMNPRNREDSEQEKYQLSEDTYTLMMLARPFSQPWLLGFAVFALQATLTSMVLFAEFRQTAGYNNTLHAPYDVTTTTRIGQMAGMVIILLYQSDYWSASTLLEIRFMNGAQGMHILFPAMIRFAQSIGVVVASTILILQSDSIINLVKDYTAILFISEIDDFVYTLADYGYLGKGFKRASDKVKEKDLNDALEHPIRSIGFMTIFGVMVGSWVYVLNNQIDGNFFRLGYPECFERVGPKRLGPMRLALSFGNGKCDSYLNYKECNFDGGDCLVENSINEANVLYYYPNCHVRFTSYIGK